MVNRWARADDEAVALHYLRYGDAEHDKLIAALPRHVPASVKMRLRNLKGLDTNGEHGLSHASKQERAVWSFAVAVRDALTDRLAAVLPRKPESRHRGGLWRLSFCPLNALYRNLSA
jgi:hypothetical protein